MEMLLEENLVSVVAMVDINPDAPGLTLARAHGIPVYHNAEQALRASAPCVAFNMTHNEMLDEVAAEVLGAGGVIGGMEARLIWRMVSNMKDAKAKLHFQASHDVLTGLFNRRYIMTQLHQGVSQSIRYRHPYAVVMLDLDHFKQVNDTYGHAAGDTVLSAMASVLRDSVRDADTVGRWGGEEFIVLLPQTDLDGAKMAAEQWLKRMVSTALDVGGDQTIHVSFSAGVAVLDLEQDVQHKSAQDMKLMVEALLRLADKRMYMAKDGGRNRVVV